MLIYLQSSAISCAKHCSSKGLSRSLCHRYMHFSKRLPQEGVPALGILLADCILQDFHAGIVVSIGQGRIPCALRPEKYSDLNLNFKSIDA